MPQSNPSLSLPGHAFSHLVALKSTPKTQAHKTQVSETSSHMFEVFRTPTFKHCLSVFKNRYLQPSTLDLDQMKLFCFTKVGSLQMLFRLFFFVKCLEKHDINSCKNIHHFSILKHNACNSVKLQWILIASKEQTKIQTYNLINECSYLIFVLVIYFLEGRRGGGDCELTIINP